MVRGVCLGLSLQTGWKGVGLEESIPSLFSVLHRLKSDSAGQPGSGSLVGNTGRALAKGNQRTV